jgi:hypothetical protein
LRCTPIFRTQGTHLLLKWRPKKETNEIEQRKRDRDRDPISREREIWWMMAGWVLNNQYVLVPGYLQRFAGSILFAEFASLSLSK